MKNLKEVLRRLVKYLILVLTLGFVIKSIKKLNIFNYDKKKINIKSIFDRNKKKIYLKI